MTNYKLLTPGPLTTSKGVKDAMQFDHCTWDEDYKKITRNIQKKLLEIAQVSAEDYAAVLIQGSGTFGVESVLTSVVGTDDKILIVSNGAYGFRMGEIAEHAGISYRMYEVEVNEIPSATDVEKILEMDPAITYVAMVHSETTSGILNDITSVGKVVKKHNKTFIVDAMSSFGGVPIDVKEIGIDFLISSANKCIQGVPGFAFVIGNKEKLIASKGKARSLSLDLYEQWKTMDKDGKWRFTSPTHVVLAFQKALEELRAEGGVKARYERYQSNNSFLREKMSEMGFETYISEHQGPIITTFLYPENHTFSFQKMYDYIKERGYAIYPGKVTEVDTFRIGNIGEIYQEDMEKICDIIKQFLAEGGVSDK